MVKILVQKGCVTVYLNVLSLIVGLKFDVMVKLLLEKTRCVKDVVSGGIEKDGV